MIYWRNVSLGFVKLADHAGDSPVASRWRIDPLFALKAVNIRLSMVIHLCPYYESRSPLQCPRRWAAGWTPARSQRGPPAGSARGCRWSCWRAIRYTGMRSYLAYKTRPATPGSVSSCTRRRSMLACRRSRAPRRASRAAPGFVSASTSCPVSTPSTPSCRSPTRCYNLRPLTTRDTSAAPTPARARPPPPPSHTSILSVALPFRVFFLPGPAACYTAPLSSSPPRRPTPMPPTPRSRRTLMASATAAAVLATAIFFDLL